MFTIKICGITSVHDARMAVLAGADAIGLNFHPPSPRYVSPEDALSIAAAVPSEVTKVGVFVNSSAEQVKRVVREVGLDAVQLHGDEPFEMLDALGPIPVVRALRLRDAEAEAEILARLLDRCGQLAHPPQAILIDAFRAGQFGGTGQTVNWTCLAGNIDRRSPIPWVLAGGLTADNVAQAIQIVRPDAVDTASGVEKRPGEKDQSLMRQFVDRARDALRRGAGGP